MGTSLWLVPTASEAARLERVMQIKSASAKSPSSFVDFDPHVTLTTIPTTPDAEAILRAAIPAGQAAIPLKFRSVDVGEKYFMSVYAVVHESDRLAELRVHLRAVLGSPTVPPVPHVSLYYIDNADRDERARVAEELRRAGRIVDHADGTGVTLNGAEDIKQATEADLLNGIHGEAIWIVKCEGPVPGWEVLQKIELA